MKKEANLLAHSKDLVRWDSFKRTLKRPCKGLSAEELVEMVKWEFFKELLVEKVGRNWSSGRIRLASDNAAILLHRAPSAFLQVGIVGMNKSWVPALIIVTSMYGIVSMVLYRQGPRLTLKKVRRGNEVPKKRDFNFDD